MNIQEAKEKLKKDGYTSFELKDFDEELYNFLLPLKCNAEKNLKNYYTNLKADGGFHFEDLKQDHSKGTIKLQNDFKSFDEASKKKNELLHIQKTDSTFILSQLWHYNDLNEIIDESSSISSFKHPINQPFSKFQKYVSNITKYFFDFEDTQEYVLFAPMTTYYDDGCKLKNHSDGTGTGRICALLIYLNEEYDENDGGILILNDEEKVIPTFGKVAIIDLQTFDIPHMVTEVTGGLGRFAILTFIKKKEDELINSSYDMKPVS
jgi:Rps23 Pro-64 3,4-dihydroxylase Tpa1-like proline 4-hydroxylase